MLPNEMADAAVFWHGLKGAIGGLVSRCRTTDGDIVNVGDRVLGNLWLKDMHHVVMEDGDSISPTHQEFGEPEHSIWCLKGGVVTRCFGEHTFIIANIQVEHSSAGMTCELLGNLFSERSDARVLDHDCIEGFEAVGWMKHFSFFLGYAEPT